MPWAPTFEASQEEALVDNVLMIVERDFKLALDHYNPIEAALPTTDPRYLHDFRERTLGQIVKNDFPCLALGPNRGTSGDGPNGECLRENILVDLYIGVTDDSPANVTRRIMKYRVALDAVLRAAPISDYFRNMSVDAFAFVLDEINYTYGPIGTERVSLFRGAVMQVPIKINER